MRVGGSRVVCEPSYVPVENLVFGRLAFKGMNQEIEAMMAEKVAAEDDSKETEVSDADMANRLTKNMAKKFATKRDKSGKPSMNK
jgi:M-phase phosphoprotein-6